MARTDPKQIPLFSRPLMAVVGITILVAVLYLPSINGEFIFDDIDNIVENPIIKDLGYYTDPSQAAGFNRYGDLRRRTVGYLTFTANYLAGGLETTGYHLVNVLIHAANALLVYALALLVFRTPFLRTADLSGRSPVIALLGAVIFAAHPIQTQAVSYVVQRLASLATLFYLASLVCYLISRLAESRNRKILFYVLSITLAALGMKSKEITFTLPLSVLMLELFFFTGSLKKRLIWWAPMALTMLIIPLTIISAGSLTNVSARGIDESLRVQTIPREHFLLTEFRVLMTYLRLIVLPFNQNLDYSYPIFRSFSPSVIWLSLIFLSTLAATGGYLFIRSRKGEPGLRVAALAIAWFFLTLSVESTLIPLFVIYEHRLYLPMAGVALGVAAGAVLLYDSLKGPGTRKAALALAVTVPLVLAVATMARNFVWRTDISIWSDVITKSPNKSRANLNLAKAYRRAGMEDKAMEQFEAALQAQSFEGYVTRVLTFISMGNHYYEKGDYARAIELYKRSIEINPEYVTGYYNLATVYLSQGEIDKALAELETAIDKDPGFAPAHYLSGEALMKRHSPSKAAESYRKALELDPQLGKARLGLAGALEAMGKQADALAQYRQAAREMSEVADAHYLLGNALKESGDLDGARNAWARAVQLEPEHARALNHLGGYYMLKKDHFRAIEYLTASLEYGGQNAEAHYNLALALDALGRTDEAAHHYRRFIELAPPEYADIVERAKTRIRALE